MRRRNRLTYRQRRARTQDRQGIALMVIGTLLYGAYVLTQVGV